MNQDRPAATQAEAAPLDPATGDDPRRTQGAGGENTEELSGSGLRMLVLGALVMVLAPLAGFLGGSIVGESQEHRIDPLAVWLFAGIVIGGVGGIIAFVGGLRWLRANRGRL